MSNDAARQLMMFSAEALTTALLLLGLFRMRSRLGLAPLYVTLGVFQPIQMLLASSIYVEILPSLVISPGSVIMFTASLFAVLLVYIREDAIEARKVIYGIMVANLTMTLLLLIFGVQLGFPDTLNFLGLPREIFNQGARVMLTGTIALFGDVILVIFVYEAVRRFIPKVPFLRIYLTMAIIFTFDTLVFATGAFYGQPNYGSIVWTGIVGKIGMAAFYAVALTIYLRFVEPADRVSLAATQSFGDIFYALTYREKYEIERERAEEALRESEAKFRTLAESAPVAILIYQGYQCVYANPMTETITGYTLEEIRQMKFWDLLHPDYKPIAVEGGRALERGESPPTRAELKIVTKAGQEKRLDGLQEIIEYEGQRASLITAVDITERVRAEEALREELRRNDLILHTTMDGYILADTEGQILEVNPAYCALVGYSREELLDMNIRQVEVELSSDEVERRIERMVAQGRDRFETKHKAQDGRVIDLETSIVIMQPAGNPLVAAFVRDITERKRAEEELREYRTHLEELVEARTAELNQQVAEVEKLNLAMTNLLKDLQAAHRKLEETARQLQRTNAELETFTYSVSHDLKAPLRGIDGYSRLLLQDYADQLDEEGRTFLHTIRRAAEQMNQLIDDLLAYSRLERRPLVRGQVNPRELVETLVAEQAEEIRERGATLTVELPCQAVIGEAEGLAQALRNLLDNALKFTRDVPEPSIEIGGRETENSCIIWVRDNGIGFDMQYHDRIFEIFQRLHRAEEYPGTGIGLAIVRKAVERMGGRVWAESAPGEGATFYLEIPR